MTQMPPTITHEDAPFWLVWSPTGPTTPRKRWPSAYQAEQEAERMAEKFPGNEFYVVMPTYLVAVGMTTRARYIDGVPF
jgi:hypothetical protein